MAAVMTGALDVAGPVNRPATHGSTIVDRLPNDGFGKGLHMVAMG